MQIKALVINKTFSHSLKKKKKTPSNVKESQSLIKLSYDLIKNSVSLSVDKAQSSQVFETCNILITNNAVTQNLLMFYKEFDSQAFDYILFDFFFLISLIQLTEHIFKFC